MSQLDTDSDGVSDADDQCEGQDDSVDVDADGIPDGCDPLVDSDADGVADASDACPGFNDSVDVDADGIPDGCDPLVDSDADGVADADDTCADTMVGTDVDSTGCAIQAEGETQAESSSRTEQLLMAGVALLVLLILVGGTLVVLRRRPEEPEDAPEGSVPAQSKPAASPAINLVNQTAEVVHFCTLCQGKIKQVETMHECTGCGKPFHSACAERLDTCPQCGTPT
jgi:hypothetical protein